MNATFFLWVGVAWLAIWLMGLAITAVLSATASWPEDRPKRKSLILRLWGWLPTLVFFEIVEGDPND